MPATSLSSRNRWIVLIAILTGTLVAACGRKPAGEHSAGEAGSTSQDFVKIDQHASAAERGWLAFGRSAFEALSARNYDAFHGLLSSHAIARMSVNQFAPAEDDAAFARNEAQARTNVALAEFRQLMAAMEERFGRPTQPINLYLHSADPAVLAGTAKQGLEALDAMFAIGNMPALVPAAQRKASLRGQIRVQLSPAQLAETAKAYETTPEALLQDPDFVPYLNVKLVVIEEAGQLRIGYFEFLPPSMLD